TIFLYDVLSQEIKTLPKHIANKVIIDARNIKRMDSTGASLINTIITELSIDAEIILEGFSKHRLILLEEVKKLQLNGDDDFTAQEMSIIEKIGYQFSLKITNLVLFINFIGSVTNSIVRMIRKKRGFSFKQIFASIEHGGVNAIPIVSLLSFLVGIVLAFQMGLQLQTYGANVYIAYYSGIAMLREFSPLITAIIAAGRTSSAYTALIGMMKINEEIDALNTMGIAAYERLVVPRVLAMLLVIPLLTFLADVFGIIGCMVMSKFMLHVEFSDYLMRIQNELELEHYLIGIGKAPIFALIISLVGCFQGFRVELSADSVGKNTTRSVVQAIFLIIIADAIFSVIFSWQNI
ncbi:MAG: ABC transporter permease, partial [Legionellales bacterium]|nr:ABC transporter permease [Legionellales bacterium]